MSADRPLTDAELGARVRQIQSKLQELWERQDRLQQAARTADTEAHHVQTRRDALRQELWALVS